MTVKLEASIHDRNVRSNLADGIEEYWVGHTTSNVGMQYVDLKDGLVVKGRYGGERTDIFCFQDFERGVNVFVETDGSISAQPWQESRPLSDAERKSVARQVKRAMEDQAEYVSFEAKFLREKPWLEIHGMIPEDAVAHLRAWEAEAKTTTAPVAHVTVTAPDGTELTSFPVYTNELGRERAQTYIGKRAVDAITG